MTIYLAAVMVHTELAKSVYVCVCGVCIAGLGCVWAPMLTKLISAAACAVPAPLPTHPPVHSFSQSG